MKFEPPVLARHENPEDAYRPQRFDQVQRDPPLGFDFSGALGDGGCQSFNVCQQTFSPVCHGGWPYEIDVLNCRIGGSALPGAPPPPKRPALNVPTVTLP